MEKPSVVNAVEHVLQSMGINQWEAGVPSMCVDVASQYCEDVLADARLYAEHAGRSHVQPEDAKLAVQAKLQTQFTAPPPREQLMELASATNSIPLPSPPQHAPGTITLPASASLLSPTTQVGEHVPLHPASLSRKRPRSPAQQQHTAVSQPQQSLQPQQEQQQHPQQR